MKVCPVCGKEYSDTSRLCPIDAAVLRQDEDPLIGKTLGDHIAAVKLAKLHGRRTASDKDTHLDLHEYVDVDWAGVTRIGEKL